MMMTTPAILCPSVRAKHLLLSSFFCWEIDATVQYHATIIIIIPSSLSSFHPHHDHYNYHHHCHHPHYDCISIINAIIIIINTIIIIILSSSSSSSQHRHHHHNHHHHHHHRHQSINHSSGDAVLSLDEVTLQETPRSKVLSLINPLNGRQEGEVSLR